jgi:hypothetical protein
LPIGSADGDIVVRVGDQRLDDHIDALGADAIVIGHEDAQGNSTAAAVTAKQCDR